MVRPAEVCDIQERIISQEDIHHYKLFNNLFCAIIELQYRFIRFYSQNAFMILYYGREFPDYPFFKIFN